MIDLRKPLEGVPGLLLLAALVLFGATIGVSLALVFSLVEMKDSLANFLAGVVGAGLGAALAVLGAVYVQRLDANARLMGPINQILSQLEFMGNQTIILRQYAEEMERGEATGKEAVPLTQQYVTQIEEALVALPEGEALPRPIHTDVHHLKRMLPYSVRTIRDCIAGLLECPPKEASMRAVLDSISYMLARIDAVYWSIRPLSGAEQKPKR